MPSHLRRPLAVLAVPLALAACAHRADLASVPAPVSAPPARPVLEPRLAAVTPPPKGPDGAYRTINSGLDPEETIWHVRAALNVAAIGCRGPENAGTVPAYNAMLAAQKTVLARANEATRADIRARGDDSDVFMTRLYNYFAMPAAKPGFCAAAATLAPQAAATAPQGFPGFAQTALPTLEAPFLAVYAQVDQYRVASAAWDDRYGATRSGAPQLAEAAAAEPRPVARDAANALPGGSNAGGGHYDLPRGAAPRGRGEAVRAGSAPRLGYLAIDQVVAWQPARHDVYAAR